MSTARGKLKLSSLIFIMRLYPKYLYRKRGDVEREALLKKVFNLLSWMIKWIWILFNDFAEDALGDGDTKRDAEFKDKVIFEYWTLFYLLLVSLINTLTSKFT